MKKDDRYFALNLAVPRIFAVFLPTIFKTYVNPKKSVPESPVVHVSI